MGRGVACLSCSGHVSACCWLNTVVVSLLALDRLARRAWRQGYALVGQIEIEWKLSEGMVLVPVNASVSVCVTAEANKVD